MRTPFHSQGLQATDQLKEGKSGILPFARI